MRAEFDHTRHLSGAEAPHHRAVEMAEKMAEATGAYGGAFYADLVAAGFSQTEIVEHEATARALCAAGFVRNIRPAGDRVPGIIEKALASAAHVMPRTAALEFDDAQEAEYRWRRYCQARAAFKLDPWLSQGERCLSHLKDFLRCIPLLEREVNRIIFAVAADQKVDQKAEIACEARRG